MHKKTMQGMSNLMLIFQDKTNPIRGLTRDEIISLYFNIPIRKVIAMKRNILDYKWKEIRVVKKYLKNTNQCAIDYQKLSKGTIIVNHEFKERQLKRSQNIFFKIVDTNIARGIRSRYDKLSLSFKHSGDKIYEIAEEEEEKQRKNQSQILEILQKNKNGKNKEN